MKEVIVGVAFVVDQFFDFADGPQLTRQATLAGAARKIPHRHIAILQQILIFYTMNNRLIDIILLLFPFGGQSWAFEIFVRRVTIVSRTEIHVLFIGFQVLRC